MFSYILLSNLIINPQTTYDYVASTNNLLKSVVRNNMQMVTTNITCVKVGIISAF